MDRLNSTIHNLFTENVLVALNKESIFTVKDFLFTDSQKLVTITLLLFNDIVHIKNILNSKYSAHSQNAYDLYKKMLKYSTVLQSGINSIDNLFKNGGLMTGSIYEICGPAASGKTFLCYTFIRELIFKTNQKCFYLDSKKDFSLSKFKSICDQPNDSSIQENLFIVDLKTIYDLLNILYDIQKKLESGSSLRLIIVDSLPPLIFNSSDVTNNNFILTQISSLIKFIAIKYHVVIIITNLLLCWNEGNFSKSENKSKVACGQFWYSVPNFRITLDKKADVVNINISSSDNYVNKSCTLLFSELANYKNAAM